MQKNCSTCGQGFEISPEELAYIGEMTFALGEKAFHPNEPSKCPTCRLRLRVAHRNEKNLYSNVSAQSGKPIISIYAPEPLWGEPYKIYSQEEWNHEGFDTMAYGREIDWNRSFFEQFFALSKDVPRMAVVTHSNENSEYTTGTAYSKNCYLINSSEYCEDCYYGKLYQTCNDVLDSAYMYDSELCYGCFSLHQCTRCTYVSFSKNSHDCAFSSGLQGCNNCFLCTNLTQKQYHFRNEPLEPEEYKKRVAEYAGSYAKYEEARAELAERMRGKIWKYANIVDSDNCTGDYIEHSRNCFECYDLAACEDCRYVQVAGEGSDCMHSSNLYLKPELVYETLGTLEGYNIAYCLYVFHCHNVLYSEQCYHCRDCIGCSGLKRKQYCIFNKQYSKEEYETLAARLIEQMQRDGEWGHFFPASRSAFSYNESLSMYYQPLTKEEAIQQGFLWREHVEAPPNVTKIVPADRLPDRIEEIPDDVIDWAVACAQSGKPFRIVKQELVFYRTHGIPLPRLHPDVRYRKRMEMRNLRTLYDRTCAECSLSVHSTFSPDRPEAVVCEQCYRKAVS